MFQFENSTHGHNELLQAHSIDSFSELAQSTDIAAPKQNEQAKILKNAITHYIEQYDKSPEAVMALQRKIIAEASSLIQKLESMYPELKSMKF